MQKKLRNSEETNDHLKLNEVVSNVYKDVDDKVLGHVGKASLTSSVITSDNAAASLENGKFLFEINDTNKRVLIKDNDGVVYYADLTRLT
jgi:hypothetical protein